MNELIELLERISTYPKEIVQYGLSYLMMQGKIDFTSLSKVYVEYLEASNKDKAEKLADANTCTMSLLTHIKKENKSNHAAIHWALHNLNESKMFQMGELNKKFSYDKENDCEYSFYYRTKQKNK